MSSSGLLPPRAVSLILAFNRDGPSKDKNRCKAYVNALWIFLLQSTPGEGTVSVMSNRPVQLHHLSYKSVTFSYELCLLSAR